MQHFNTVLRLKIFTCTIKLYTSIIRDKSAYNEPSQVVLSRKNIQPDQLLCAQSRSLIEKWNDKKQFFSFFHFQDVAIRKRRLFLRACFCNLKNVPCESRDSIFLTCTVRNKMAIDYSLFAKEGKIFGISKLRKR